MCLFDVFPVKSFVNYPANCGFLASQHTQSMLQQASSPPVPEVMRLCAYPA